MTPYKWLAFAAEIVLLNHRIEKYPYWGATLVAMNERRDALIEWFEFETARRSNCVTQLWVGPESNPHAIVHDEARRIETRRTLVLRDAWHSTAAHLQSDDDEATVPGGTTRDQ